MARRLSLDQGSEVRLQPRALLVDGRAASEGSCLAVMGASWTAGAVTAAAGPCTGRKLTYSFDTQQVYTCDDSRSGGCAVTGRENVFDSAARSFLDRRR